MSNTDPTTFETREYDANHPLTREVGRALGFYPHSQGVGGPVHRWHGPEGRDVTKELLTVMRILENGENALMAAHAQALAEAVEAVIGPDDERPTRNHGSCNPACHAISVNLTKAQQRAHLAVLLNPQPLKDGSNEPTN